MINLKIREDSEMFPLFFVQSLIIQDFENRVFYERFTGRWILSSKEINVSVR